MSEPSSTVPAEHDPVIAAFDAAPVDAEALSPDEARALDAQMAAAAQRLANGEAVLRESADVTAQIAARASHEG